MSMAKMGTSDSMHAEVIIQDARLVMFAENERCDVIELILNVGDACEWVTAVGTRLPGRRGHLMCLKYF